MVDGTEEVPEYDFIKHFSLIFGFLRMKSCISRILESYIDLKHMTYL